MLYAVMRMALKPVVHQFFKGNIEGLEHLPERGPYLLAANHSSYFDHLVLNALLAHYRHEPLYILAKKEAFEHPLATWWSCEMGVIPLEHSKPDPAAIRETLRVIRQGNIVAIFPEGTRALNGQIQPGKAGIIRLAAMAGVPIIPIGLRGTFDVLPPGQKLPHFHHVGVHIGQPFHFAHSLRGKQLEQAMQALMNSIASLAGQRAPRPELQEMSEGQYWTEMAAWCFEQAHRDATTRSESAFWLKRAYHAACGAIKRAPDMAQTWWVYGRVLGFMGLQAGMPGGLALATRSRKAMEQALLLNPNYPYPYYGLGLWYEKTPHWLGGGVVAAKVFYEQAARLAPHEIFVQLAYARICAQAGLHNEACAVLRWTLTEPPKSLEDQRRLNTAALLLQDLTPMLQRESYSSSNLKTRTANSHPFRQDQACPG